MPIIKINNHQYDVNGKMTILEVARTNNIKIPSLCYHPALKPSGSCKLCAVEVKGKSEKNIMMLSCIMKAKEGLVVRTDTEMVSRARRNAFRHLIHMAPYSKRIRQLAKDFCIELGPLPDGCVRCRLCIRVCKEIVGPGALKMIERDKKKYVVPNKGLCIGCGTCANICPTGAIKIQDKDNVRTISIRDEVIGRHPLERCEGCGRLYATPKFLEHIESRTIPHPDVKIHHKYCPFCAKLFSDRVKAMGTRLQIQRMPGHK